MRLNFKEFLPYAPEYPGVVRVNHDTTECHGESKSLRIERKDNGDVFAKCFRCGASGVSFGDRHNPRTFLLPKAPEKGGGVGRIDFEIGSFPLVALKWLRQYGITNEEIVKYKIGFSFAVNRVILPIFWGGEQVGYQARRIYDTDTGPKYITRNFGGGGCVIDGPSSDGGIVIVEDIISAIKVGRQQQAIAIMSTNITTKIRAFLSNYNKFWIWLDMDNPQVIRAAVKLLNSLRIYGEVKLLKTEQDPKCYSDSDISERLYGS